MPDFTTYSKMAELIKPYIKARGIQIIPAVKIPALVSLINSAEINDAYHISADEENISSAFIYSFAHICFMAMNVSATVYSEIGVTVMEDISTPYTRLVDSIVEEIHRN